MRSPALISTCSKAGCYAVLASLSGRYPPFEGRSPTCYSPVRHSTQGRSPFRVRLACVRHAASVDSEPGSNSHVKFAVWQCFLARLTARKGSLPRNLLTRAPVDLALALFRTCVVDGCKPSADTRRAVPPSPAVAPLGAPTKLWRDACCACTHYLVFKEPDATPDAAALCLVGTCTWLYPGCPPPTMSARSRDRFPLQGNLVTLLPSSWPVNPIRRARRTGMLTDLSEGPP